MTKKKKSNDRDGLHRRRGVWFYGYRDPETGRWREVSTRTRNFTEARDIRRKDLQDFAEGLLKSNKARLPLEIAFDEWLEYASLHYVQSTINLHRERSKPLLAEMGMLKLEQINIDRVRAYQKKRAQTVSNRTVNLETQTLRNTMSFHGLWRGALKGDFKNLPEKAANIGRALEPEEQRRCWEVARKTLASMRTYNMSVLYSNTGLRKTEFLRLKIKQLDLHNAEIRIERSKTDAGKRIVPLNEHALIAAAFVLELAQRKGATKPDDYLFPAFLHRRRKAGEKRSGYDAGSPQKTFRTAWRNFIRKAGLQGLRVHDLRHHFITTLAENDTPIATAKSIVGHMSEQMIARYTHIRDRAKRKAVVSVEPTNPIPAAEFRAALVDARKSGRKAKYLKPMTTHASDTQTGIDHVENVK